MDLSEVHVSLSPSPDASMFWEGIAKGEFRIPFCESCDHRFWYPRRVCPSCGSRRVSWQTSSGRGTVHAYCVSYQTSVSHLRELCPFVTALVDIDGVRVLGLVDAAADAIGFDDEVVVSFRVDAADRPLFVFEPLSERTAPAQDAASRDAARDDSDNDQLPSEGRR